MCAGALRLPDRPKKPLPLKPVERKPLESVVRYLGEINSPLHVHFSVASFSGHF